MMLFLVIVYMSYWDFIGDLADGKRVLHVGCVGTWRPGHNNFACHKFLSKRAESVYGIDVDESGIACMNQEGFAVTVASGETFTSAVLYQSVMILSVLQFVRDPIVMLRNLQGVLESGGTIVVEVPNVYSFSNLVRNLFKFGARKNVQANGQSEWGEVSVFNASVLSNLLYLSGFEDVVIRSFQIKKCSTDKTIRENIRILCNNIFWFFGTHFGPSLVAVAKKK